MNQIFVISLFHFGAKLKSRKRFEFIIISSIYNYSSAGNVYSVLLMTENGSSWLREIRHAQHEYLQRLGLPTVESMIGVNTLLGIDPGIGDTDTNPHPWVPP